MKYKVCMRIPESLDEYEHILNATGWTQQGVRKKGSIMRRLHISDFVGGYREVLNQRITFLKERVDALEGHEGAGHPLICKQRDIVVHELARRLQQLTEVDGI